MSTISGDYPRPVQVNGYACHNCTEVDLAKKHIDPQHPKSGPFGVDAAEDPTRSAAVKFGGALSGTSPDPGPRPDSQGYRAGRSLDLKV